MCVEGIYGVEIGVSMECFPIEANFLLEDFLLPVRSENMFDLLDVDVETCFSYYSKENE